MTDYYTLWGLPNGCSELFAKAKRDLIGNGQTDVPIGIGTHNIIITADMRVLMRVSSPGAGFSAGRISMSYEEQMDPEKDAVLWNTPFRGAYEELASIIPPEDTYLLGAGLEKRAAYVAFCFVQLTNLSSEKVAQEVLLAPDRDETSGLLAVPFKKLVKYSAPEIGFGTWGKHQISESKIPKDTSFKTHATTSWRLGLVQNFLASIN